MKASQACWWVSASQDWSWMTFFKKKGVARQANDWGGPDWIRSPISYARIKAMRAGDYVISYQAGSGIVGFAQLKSDGYKARGSAHFDTFDLRGAPAIWLETPIPLNVIKQLPHARNTFEFVRTARGTVFAVAKGGMQQIVDLAVAFNPGIRKRLTRLPI